MHRTNPDLTRQDDVFLRPGMGTLADRANVQLRKLSRAGAQHRIQEHCGGSPRLPTGRQRRRLQESGNKIRINPRNLRLTAVLRATRPPLQRTISRARALPGIENCENPGTGIKLVP